jgi:Domain of unknown function (DUF1874)
MINKKLVFLNASVLTSYGKFRFEKLSLEQAKDLIKEFAIDETKQIESAIGHLATAEILTELLEFKVEPNRIEFIQTAEDVALIFRLKRRAPEGAVLNRAEIEEIGYEFGLLTKIN